MKLQNKWKTFRLRQVKHIQCVIFQHQRKSEVTFGRGSDLARTVQFARFETKTNAESRAGFTKRRLHSSHGHGSLRPFFSFPFWSSMILSACVNLKLITKSGTPNLMIQFPNRACQYCFFHHRDCRADRRLSARRSNRIRTANAVHSDRHSCFADMASDADACPSAHSPLAQAHDMIVNISMARTWPPCTSA